MRVFISIDIPDNVKEEILRIQKKLPEFSGKLTEEENLHLTLKFLGEIDEKQVKEIKDKLSEIKLERFYARLGEVGVFNKKFIKIIWIKLDNCEKLQKEIDSKLSDLFPKEKRFMSHLTIARVKNIKDKKKFISEIEKIKINKINFLVSEFKLKKSTLTQDGPVYEDILEVELD